ncbi:MAG: manganese efflux pump [Bacilli bacterium]|nr:manganese efflux pump [Bacilli bacterium]
MLCLELFFIGISLSIDAFSLAVSIGINSKIYKKHKLYAFIVGLFHFFMPIFGFLLRTVINYIVILPNKMIFSIVLVLIMFEIITEKENTKSYINPVIFAFSVSLDSFTIGISLDKSKILIASLIFSITSFLFSYFGFIIANKIRKKFSKNLKFISIGILLIILVYNILI